MRETQRRGKRVRCRESEGARERERERGRERAREISIDRIIVPMSTWLYFKFQDNQESRGG